MDEDDSGILLKDTRILLYSSVRSLHILTVGTYTSHSKAQATCRTQDAWLYQLKGEIIITSATAFISLGDHEACPDKKARTAGYIHLLMPFFFVCDRLKTNLSCLHSVSRRKSPTSSLLRIEKIRSVKNAQES